MVGFFNNLDNYSKFYFVIAIIGTISFLTKLLLMFANGDDGTDIHDLDANFDHDTSFTFLSIQSVLSFLMGAGWIGLAAKAEWKFGNINSIIASAIAGFAAMFLMAYLMMQVKKLGKNPKFNLNECVGISGKAYTRFAPKGTGQIQMEAGGKLRTLNAVNGTDEEIPAFAAITVTEVSNNTVFVSQI